jgi:hypothetical protein
VAAGRRGSQVFIEADHSQHFALWNAERSRQWLYCLLWNIAGVFLDILQGHQEHTTAARIMGDKFPQVIGAQVGTPITTWYSWTGG